MSHKCIRYKVAVERVMKNNGASATTCFLLRFSLGSPWNLDTVTTRLASYNKNQSWQHNIYFIIIIITILIFARHTSFVTGYMGNFGDQCSHHMVIVFLRSLQTTQMMDSHFTVRADLYSWGDEGKSVCWDAEKGIMGKFSLQRLTAELMCILPKFQLRAEQICGAVHQKWSWLVQQGSVWSSAGVCMITSTDECDEEGVIIDEH